MDLLNGCHIILEVKAVRSHNVDVRYSKGRVGSLNKKDISNCDYKMVLMNLMCCAMMFVNQICRLKHLVYPPGATSDLGS